MDNQKFRAFETISAALASVVVIALALFFQSCQTPRVAQSTNMQSRDSLRSEIITRTDTLIIHDTIYIESKTTYNEASNTHITFGAEGGTYNVNTGEATNVLAVDKDDEVEYLNEVVASLTEDNYRLCGENHQLQEEIKNLSEQQTQEPQEMSRWERFFYISGYVLWGVVVVLLILLTIKIIIKIKRAMP